MQFLPLKALGLCLALLIPSFVTTAQSQNQKSYLGVIKNGSLYFSWGYNTEWYTKSNVHVNQPSLNNNYQLRSISAHDHRGWDENFFHTALTVPQYNYRLGYFFNEKQDFAFEINFDHTKYIITDNQAAHLKGTLSGEQVDKTIDYSGDKGFYYFLNNGANFLLFNLVKKFEIYHTDNRYFKIDLLTKAGIGPVIPHVENSFFGKANDPGFQLGGWNAGIETALRATVLKYAYIEFAQKADYARYSNLKVYEGRAHQAFGTYELILSLGITLPTGKHNTQFHPKPTVSNAAETNEL
jgi:hypothetical protein